jgi:hypothetical protein
MTTADSQMGLTTIDLATNHSSFSHQMHVQKCQKIFAAQMVKIRIEKCNSYRLIDSVAFVHGTVVMPMDHQIRSLPREAKPL